MIKTKKGLRHKNKLTGHADTEPSVSADFNGDSDLISNSQSPSNIQATINSAHETEVSAQTRDNNEIVDFNAIDEVDLDVEDLAHLLEQAKVLEKKNKLKHELKAIYRRLDTNNTINNSGLTLNNQTSHALGETSMQRSFKN